MARGDMLVKTETAGTGVEILNREPFRGVSMTIDFSGEYKTDSQTGEKVVKAGTPIDKDGKAVTSSPWDGAVGILLVDVRESRPQGTILTEAYINTTRAEANSELTYDGELVKAMNNAGNRIRFEERIVTATEKG